MNIWEIISWVKKYWYVVFLLMILLQLAMGGAYLKGKGYVWAAGTGFIDKTLWDWLELLVVPVVLALAAIFFNRQERQNELRIADERNQEAVLQNFFDKINQLILEKGLREPISVREILLNPNSKVDLESNAQLVIRDMAHIRTSTVLRQLNAERRNIVLKFLRDARLMSFILSSANMQGIDLSKADLSGANLNKASLIQTDLNWANLREANLTQANLIQADLCWANLGEADLREANFIQAHLRGAYLSNANLRGAILNWANLRRADLSDADLSGAFLNDANLRDANLKDANLKDANLTKAKVTNEQLASAKSLENATMPDGKKYDPAIHLLKPSDHKEA